MPTSWTVGGRLADRFAGRPEYARAKGAEGAEDAEEEGVSRNRRGARRFCTLAVQMDLARQAATKYLNLSIHRRAADWTGQSGGEGNTVIPWMLRLVA